MVRIRSRDDLSSWLLDKPVDWGKVVLVRAAMRLVPYGVNLPKKSDKKDMYELSLFRALFISWSVVNWPKINERVFLTESLLDAGEALFTQALARANAGENDAYCVASIAALASFASAEASSKDVALAAESGTGSNVGPNYDLVMAIGDWHGIENDCNWLLSQAKPEQASRVLTRRSLWLGRSPEDWNSLWRHAQLTLLERSHSFSIWVEWFNRRIKGERAAFDIAGDRNRIEDKAIIALLASADEDDFWSKGPAFVNASLELWLDESRARVAPQPQELLPEAPTQDSSAIAYGVNRDGKLDRLPASKQQQLRDIPNQRQIYNDVREAFIELLGEGQRLGDNLTKVLERICLSMPEKFEDAQAYLVWRDGIKLRSIYVAHQAVVHNAEPDPAKLEIAIAANLDAALKLFNLFAFGDDGLRAKDEAAIPPQEKISAVLEAELAKPVVAAMLGNPDMATSDVLDDVHVSLEDNGISPENPYAPHTIDQIIRNWRNLIAAVIAYGRAHPLKMTLVGAGTVAGPVADGFLDNAGGAIFTDIMGSTKVYTPVINFIVANAAEIKAYAITAYSNGSVGQIIDAIVQRFGRSE